VKYREGRKLFAIERKSFYTGLGDKHGEMMEEGENRCTVLSPRRDSFLHLPTYK